MVLPSTLRNLVRGRLEVLASIPDIRCERRGETFAKPEVTEERVTVVKLVMSFLFALGS